MKRKFTKLMAALALLVFMTPSLVAWGQTRESYNVTYGYSDLGDMLYGSYLDASSYWKVPETSGNTAVISIPITNQPESNITVSFHIATFGSGTNPSSSNTTITASGTESNSNWTGSGVSSYPSSSTYVDGVMTITKPQNPTTLEGLEITMGVNTGVKIFRLQSITVEYTYGGGSTPTTYTVTYDCNGGTSGCPENVNGIEAGEEITLANAPTKDGFDFAGWNDGNNTYNAGDEYTVNGNVTFTAQWTEVVSGDEQWVLTSLADLTTNDVFVIVGNGSYALPNDHGTSSSPDLVPVSVEGTVLTGNIAGRIKWTVSGNATDGFTFYPNGSTNTWLYCNTTASSSSNNNIRVGIGNRKVFKLNNNNYLVTNDTYTARYLCIYVDNNNVPTDWRGYTSTTSAATMSFYKKVTGGVIPPSITAEDVNILYNATSGSISYTINNGVEGGAVTSAEVTASNPENWLTVNGNNPYASPISLSCAPNTTATEKTATVTLTYTYNRETVTETVNVTQAADPNATMTIAAVRALNTGATVATKGVVTSISVSGNNKTAYMQDNTAGIVAFGPFTTEVAVGDEIRVEGELTAYHGLLEIGKNNAAPTVTVLSQNNTVDPVVKTIAEISNDIQAQLVKVENATVTAIDGQNTTIAQGENTIVVRGISGVEYAVNDVLTLTANVGCYDNPQLVNPQNVEVQHNTTPVINASNPETLAYNATSGSIVYTISNSVEGVSLNANTTANWISNIVVGESEVTFTTTVNEGTEDRTATFVLTYEGADDKEITVTQGHPVVDYATLPFTWDDAATPTGVTRENVGSYSSSPRLKFNNNTGEGYVILKVNEAPGAIVFDIKANPGSGTTSTGIFSVMTSNNGTDYNTLVTYNEIINQKQTLSITNISADTRYIKWSYDKTTSTSGNVAVGNIIVTKAVNVAENTTWTVGTNTPEDNYTYIVNNGATLTLNGDYSVYFDKPYYLVVKDGGQLVAANPGQGTLQKSIAACEYNNQNNAGYNLIASPVSTNLTAANVNGLLTTDYDLYKFDNTAELEWLNYKAEAFTIDSEVGYLYASGSNTVIEFAGTLNGYEELYEVTIPNAGFNLIGNPFACNVYVYDASSNAMNFQVLNGAGQEFTNGSTIKAGDAFLVQTTAANQKLYINHESISKASAVTLNVEKNRGSVIDNVRVRFGEGQSMNKFYLNENDTHIFIPQGNEEMAVVRSANEAEMPVSFKASENGTYTLAIEAENVEMNYLHLIDNMTGMDVDLLQTPSYTFDAKTNDYTNRFRLVFSANSANEQNAETFAYFNGSNWTVSNLGEATLQVVDVTGRTLSSETINGNATINLNQTPGVYMLRLVNGNSVKVQKVVVR